MSNVIISGIPGFYIYWGRSATWKGGDPTSDEHMPFNPITEGFGITLPERIYELIPAVSDLYPLINVDKNLEPSTITIKTHFRDPFMLLCMFTYKALPSNWTGTSDNILANFSNRDDITPNLWIQLRLPDPSGGSSHVDLLFDGGVITEYRLVGEEQHSVKEEIDIKFAEISENTQAMDIDDGLDDGEMDATGIDGGWAWWNRTLFATKNSVLLTKDITISGVSVVGLQVQSWQLTLPLPKAMEFVASSMVAGITYEEVRGPWLLELSGKLSGNTNISEAIAELADKTKYTAKIAYDIAPLEKYIQFTNAVLKNIDGISVPAAGEPIDVTYVYEGAGSSVLTYSWTGTQAVDPSAYIDHTDV